MRSGQKISNQKEIAKMCNIFEHIITLLNSAFAILFFAVIGLSLFLSIWMALDTNDWQKLEGSMERGFKIWGQSLTAEQLNYLNLAEDGLIEIENFPKYNPRLIRKNNGQVLIYREIRSSRAAPCFGYINLTHPNPVLEFRLLLPIHLLFLVIGLIFPPIIIVDLIISLLEKQSIEHFLQKTIQKGLTTTQ